jgi:hypothetical protein
VIIHCYPPTNKTQSYQFVSDVLNRAYVQLVFENMMMYFLENLRGWILSVNTDDADSINSLKANT